MGAAGVDDLCPPVGNRRNIEHDQRARPDVLADREKDRVAGGGQVDERRQLAAIGEHVWWRQLLFPLGPFGESRKR